MSFDRKSIITRMVDSSKIEFKDDLLSAGWDTNPSDITWIPSKVAALDTLLGKGLPLGRIIEVFGAPSHGKSTIAQEMMTSVQRVGGLSVLIDTESSWDRERALRMGHNEASHLHFYADTLEAAFDRICFVMKQLAEDPAVQGMPCIIVWDTYAAAQIESEKQGKMYGDGMAGKPKLLLKGLRKITPLLSKTKTLLVIVNQTITVLGGYKASEDSPGKGLKFFASARLKVKKVGDHVINDVKVGILSELSTVKNKMTAPNKVIALPILFKDGIDVDHHFLMYASTRSPELLSVDRGWFCFNIPEITLPKMRLADVKGKLIEGNPAAWELFKQLVIKHMQENI